MTQLSQCLQELFSFLEKQHLRPPSQDVRVVEIRRDAVMDDRGRFRIPYAALRKPVEYESRFEEIVKLGLPWVNMSCYGVHDGFLVVAIEIPERKGEEVPSPRLTVNYSGPPASVIQSGWRIEAIAVVE